MTREEAVRAGATVKLRVKEEAEINGLKLSPGDVVVVTIDEGKELLREGKVYLAEVVTSAGEPVGLEKR